MIDIIEYFKQYWIFISLIMLLVWLIAREFKCWYLKINDRVELMNTQIEIQKEQLEEMKEIKTMVGLVIDGIYKDVEEEHSSIVK